MRPLPQGYAGHLELIRKPDVEGDDNRGYRADLIEAFVDDGPAGYAATLFIPRDRFDRWYPNGIWDFLRHHSGKTGLPESPHDPGALKSLELYNIHLGVPDDVADPVAETIRRLDRRYAKQWASFQVVDVDRPKMDYIRVYEDTDDHYRTCQGGRRRLVQRQRLTNFRGLGIGSALYREMARWHAEAGLRLHSSALRELEAEAVWLELADALPQAVTPERREKILAFSGDARMLILDGSQVPSCAPTWAATATLVLEDGRRQDLRRQAVKANA